MPRNKGAPSFVFIQWKKVLGAPLFWYIQKIDKLIHLLRYEIHGPPCRNSFSSDRLHLFKSWPMPLCWEIWLVTSHWCSIKSCTSTTAAFSGCKPTAWCGFSVRNKSLIFQSQSSGTRYQALRNLKGTEVLYRLMCPCALGRFKVQTPGATATRKRDWGTQCFSVSWCHSKERRRTKYRGAPKYLESTRATHHFQ